MIDIDESLIPEEEVTYSPTLPCVVIESPYAGNVERNTAYARACLKDSLSRGEAPIASHLLYTQVLDDTRPEERDAGISAGLAWLDKADLQVFYMDLGMSPGMKYAEQTSRKKGPPIQYRKIPGWERKQ